MFQQMLFSEDRPELQEARPARRRRRLAARPVHRDRRDPVRGPDRHRRRVRGLRPRRRRQGARARGRHRLTHLVLTSMWTVGPSRPAPFRAAQALRLQMGDYWGVSAPSGRCRHGCQRGREVDGRHAPGRCAGRARSWTATTSIHRRTGRRWPPAIRSTTRIAGPGWMPWRPGSMPMPPPAAVASWPARRSSAAIGTGSAAGGANIWFLHLDAPHDVVERRMRERRGHQMPVSLLDSQEAALEPLQPDEDGLTHAGDPQGRPHREGRGGDARTRPEVRGTVGPRGSVRPVRRGRDEGLDDVERDRERRRWWSASGRR